MKNLILILLLFTFRVSFAQEQSFSQNDFSNLEKLNLISVTVGGEFLVNGTFPAMRTERVDQFITRIFNESKIAAMQTARDEKSAFKLQKNIKSYATRGILLKRIDGTELKIDLDKFRLTADFSINPYLKEGDVLIFPVYNEDLNFVEISGAVGKPGKYSFFEGDKLSDLILIARGIPSYYERIETIEVSRLSADGNKEEIIRLKITEDFELKAGDRVNIIPAEVSKKDYKVLVLGEVKRPGYVYVTKSNTKISDVIAKAGGTKEDASLKMAELIRNNNAISLLRKESIEKQIEAAGNFDLDLKLFDKIEMMLSGRMANITHEDTSFFSLDNKLRLMQSRHNIDFENLEDPKNDVYVRDGDVILIPEKTNLIYVYGQVAAAGYYQFDETKSVMQYISEAGGIGEDAQDKEEIVVIKAKTYEWKTLEDNENMKLEPGDLIWVPKAPPRTLEYYVRSIGTVIGALGTLALIVIQIWVK